MMVRSFADTQGVWTDKDQEHGTPVAMFAGLMVAHVSCCLACETDGSPPRLIKHGYGDCVLADYRTCREAVVEGTERFARYWQLFVRHIVCEV